MSGTTNSLQDIIAYEKQLLADREQLCKLLETYQNESDAVIRDKLCFFESELKHMNYQYDLLKKQIPQGKQTDEVKVPNTPLVSHSQPSDIFVKKPTVQLQPRSQAVYTPENPQPEKKQFAGFEKMVGSSLMGVLASGLIFISIILFATLIIPYLGDVVKLAACYLISFLMIGISLHKLKKDNHNKFQLALSGCGVGALYITLLLTNIYFKYIGDLPLFALISVWVSFVCYLSRTKSPIFHVIGQIGVTISIFLGATLCINKDDFSKYVFLTVFYIIAYGTLSVTHYHKEVACNKIANTFGCINMVTFLFSGLFFEQNIYYLFLTLIAVIHLLVLFCGKWEKSEISYGVFTAIYTCLLACGISSFVRSPILQGLLIYVLAYVVLFLSEFKPKNHRTGMYIIHITMMVLACLGLLQTESLFDHGYILLLVLPLLLPGFLRGNDICKHAALLLTFVYLTDIFSIFPDELSLIEQCINGFLVIIPCYILMWLIKEGYSQSFKVCLHLLGIIYLYKISMWITDSSKIDMDTSMAVFFLLVAIYNIGVSHSPLKNNLKSGEEESPACYNIINVFLMLMALAVISMNTPLHFPVILVSLAVFYQNCKHLLDTNEKIWAGIYVGLKFTVLLVVILNSFDTANYVISSLCLLFAVCSIAFGFVKEYKSLRVYGLALSMISVFKLIMLDIHYENTLGNALSFFIAGVLCFAISMLYNYIDKKIINEKED